MQLKLFVMHLPIGVMIVSLIFVSQVVFSAAVAVVADEEQTDIIELEEYEGIKQELGPSETNPTENDIVKQEGEEEGEDEDQQESNGDTAGTELEDDNIMIDDDNYLSDKVPFDLPFDDIVPFP
jgi:hypothetical protein